MDDNARRRIKIYLVIGAQLFGWLQTLTHWSDATTPGAIGGLGTLVISAAFGIFGITTTKEKEGTP